MTSNVWMNVTKLLTHLKMLTGKPVKVACGKPVLMNVTTVTGNMMKMPVGTNVWVVGILKDVLNTPTGDKMTNGNLKLMLSIVGYTLCLVMMPVTVLKDLMLIA